MILRLHRHVQRRGRFVQQQRAGVRRERAGDAGALLLAAGEFVRVARQELRAEPDIVEQGGHAVAQRAAGQAAHEAERLGHGRGDGAARVQRGVRVLEHHLDLAAQVAQPAFGEAGDGRPVEQDLAAGGGDQAQQQPEHGGFPRAGFADHAEGLAGAEGEGHMVDGRVSGHRRR